MTVSTQDTANAIRALSIDAVEGAKLGHVSLPFGMADPAISVCYDGDVSRQVKHGYCFVPFTLKFCAEASRPVSVVQINLSLLMIGKGSSAARIAGACAINCAPHGAGVGELLSA